MCVFHWAWTACYEQGTASCPACSLQPFQAGCLIVPQTTPGSGRLPARGETVQMWENCIQGETMGEERVIWGLVLGFSYTEIEVSIASVICRTRHAESMSVALIPQAIWKDYGYSLHCGDILNIHTSHSCIIVHKQGHGLNIQGQKNVLLN